VPRVRGAVFITGIGQQTSSVGTYKANLQSWYADTPFWADMAAYVSDWSQEVYGDVRSYAVAGASLETRRDELAAYTQHGLALANAGPAEVATAKAFLQTAYSPLANSAWAYDAAYGWSAVPFDQMQDYVSAQTYALAAAGGHFGFAWALKNLTGLSSTDFANQTGAIADRLAAAIATPRPRPRRRAPGRARSRWTAPPSTRAGRTSRRGRSPRSASRPHPRP
jgi:hypothetical protein